MNRSGTCSCARARTFDGLDDLDDLVDELDDEAAFAEDDLFDMDDAFAPRPRAGGLGFVLTCTNAQRRRRFSAALRLAISIARHAAARLTATPIDANARRLFIHFFGTRPEHRPAWATRTAAGLVAHRYSMVARELAGGRRIRYTCAAGTAGGCDAATFAITTGKSAVTLCDAFFAPARTVSQMAGTLLHEGMHAVYWDLFDHAVASGIAECRRDNARCFQAFALRLRGFGISADISTRCRRSAQQCRRLP